MTGAFFWAGNINFNTSIKDQRLQHGKNIPRRIYYWAKIYFGGCTTGRKYTQVDLLLGENIPRLKLALRATVNWTRIAGLI